MLMVLHLLVILPLDNFQTIFKYIFLVSESLSNNCEHFIFTFIHGKDLIPRLSYYSVYKLFKKVEKSYYKTGETTQQFRNQILFF